MTYLDWCMIIITTLTTVSMMFETPTYRVMDNSILQIMDYAFVIGTQNYIQAIWAGQYQHKNAWWCSL